MKGEREGEREIAVDQTIMMIDERESNESHRREKMGQVRHEEI